MQTVYAAHLPLPDQPDGANLDAAATVLVNWVGSRFDVQMTPLSGGEAVRRGVDVRWESLLGRGKGLISATIDQPDRNDSGWRWRTYVDLGVENNNSWLRVRVHLYSPTEGRLTSPKVRSGRPGIVRNLTDALDIRTDGWLLGEWRPVERQHAATYQAFLLDPARQLPIVALSRQPGGEPFLDPARTADRLLGLAHVVLLEADAAYEITDRIGKSLSCFSGAVRIYWPGFTPEDDPYHHRLFVGGSLNHYGRDGLEAELFDILGRLAGLSIDEPPLRRNLKLEERERALRRHEEERQQLRTRLEQSSTSGTTDPAFAEFVEEFSRLEAHASELEHDALDAAVEIETLRRERDDARTQTIAIATSINSEARAPVVEVPVAPPQSVEEAVKRAADVSEHTLYLDEAFASARESGYEDPARVLEDLCLIEEVARDWASGELAAGPHQAFKQRCSGYRDGIGNKASTMYASDYDRVADGVVIQLGPHIRRGIGAVSTIMRIYMYFDTANRKIVVGHVGRKLRDVSNRN